MAGSECKTRHQLYGKLRDRLSHKLHGRAKRKKRDTIPIERKHTYRVKARDVKKNNLVFFKTRTKEKQATIKRFATQQGFIPERIKV